MSFDQNGGGMLEVRAAVDCKPNYEKQAANLKKKLGSTIALADTLFHFMDINDTYRFGKISSLAELVGTLAIVRWEQKRNYESLLNNIEKD